MLLLNFLQAWVIGIAVAAPVGPIGLLCIRRTLENGMLGLRYPHKDLKKITPDQIVINSTY